MATTYLIVYGTDPSDRLAAYSFPDRKTAWEASTSTTYLRGSPERPHAGGCAYVVENEGDVTFGLGLLVAIYNGLTDSSIKKFESRPVGIRRLLAILPQVATPTKPKESEMEPNTEQATNGGAAPAKRGGRVSKVNKAATIHMVADGNPKRAGSAAHGRYALYQEGMTVAAFLDAGGTVSDIDNDTKKGYVALN